MTELKPDLNANIRAFKPDGESPNYNTELAFPSTPLQYSCLENPVDGGAW